ncbi:MAG: hypothetical protein F4X02_17585 [Chloroflexi bacterium]|nr:hypothetical protein [Chloroflexota bacterium]
MSTASIGIEVTSHVSRDLLQSSAYFNTFGKVVWEYVSNSLDAAKDHEPVLVDVEVTDKQLRISDNGRGMSRTELMTFFQMHGENIQRRRGKRVRGRFGTGKSAAFGLASALTIDTVQGGLRNVVRLTRRRVLAASDGKPIPVEELELDKVSSGADGTTITVERFVKGKRPRVEKVVQYVERHLSRHRGRAEVIINGHVCRFDEVEFRANYDRRPPDHVSKYVGDVVLSIKVAYEPLDEERAGIDVLSYGIWHATTLVGIENKERSQYIFGEVDVPVLEDGEWEIPPFDNTRSVKLNDQNPTVAILLGWISEELEQVRLELVKEENQRRKSEQARKLEKEAERIARILNEDFAQQEMELEKARRARNLAGHMSVDDLPGGEDGLSPGNGDIPGSTQESGNEHGDGNGGENVSEGETPRPGPSLMEGSDSSSQKSLYEGRRKRRRAVFSLEYESGSSTMPRSRYETGEKTIYINLEHPQIANALLASNGNISGKQFREMSYEVAAIEYSLALQYETMADNDTYDAFAALDELRHTVNRITSRIAAALYVL